MAIALRGVRNRGTVGGSLCHAAPRGRLAERPGVGRRGGRGRRTGRGRRVAPVAGFLRGPFEPALDAGEVLVRVRVPRPLPGTRFGWRKMVRKTGEFAERFSRGAVGQAAAARLAGGFARSPERKLLAAKEAAAPAGSGGERSAWRALPDWVRRRLRGGRA